MLYFTAHIARGIGELNVKGPDNWIKKVDPTTLRMDKISMDSGKGCILAQLYDYYMVGKNRLNLTTYEAIECGFALDDSAYNHFPVNPAATHPGLDQATRAYSALTAEWIAALDILRAHLETERS